MKKLNSLYFLGLVFLQSHCIFLNPIHATELYEQNTSVRALGMGNAYTSVVRDSDSLFYNPAALGMNSGIYWTILDPRAHINNPNALADLSDFQDPSKFATALTNLSGKYYSLSAGAKSVMRFFYFAFGAYDSVDAGLGLDESVSPVMDVNFINDFGYILGFGVPVFPFTYFGASARYITRTGNRTQFEGAALASLDQQTLSDAVSNKGTGIALDAGLTFSVNTFVNPTFSIVAKNIGGTSFTAVSGKEAPPSDKQELIAGASIATNLGLLSFTPSLEIKHLDESDVKLGRKLHIGFELGLPLIDIRGGFNQQYWTAGVGLGIGPVQIDAATYGVNVGDDANPKEDRRYAIQLTIELGLNLGFGGSGSGSETTRSRRRDRRLKQRR